MGTTPHGINGQIQGKVGTVHGSSRNGKPYIKGPYKKRTKKISKKELANRVSFKSSNQWLKPITAFLREGFKGFVYKADSQGYSAALSYLSTHAREGIKPDQTINPALMQVSYGSLALSSNIAVEKTDRYVLKFTWDKDTIPHENADVSLQSLKDQVMLLAYNIEKGKAVMNVTGQFRGTGEDFLYLPKVTYSATYHIYVAFVTADRSSRSHSVYLGSITVA